MSAEHAATASPLVKELVADVIEFVREHEGYAVNQAAMIHPADSRKAAETAIYEVWTEAQDHLQIRLAVTLATHGIGEPA